MIHALPYLENDFYDLTYLVAYQFVSRAIEFSVCSKRPGGRLNKKDGLTRYGNSHVKDKTS